MQLQRQEYLYAAVLLAALTVTSAASAMSVSFSWKGIANCSTSSPAFTLGAVPNGTTQLDFKMVDTDLPDYPHGGGKVAYVKGSQIPAASFSYTGPCPPALVTHNYQWTVKALDVGGKVLATATASRPYPPR